MQRKRYLIILLSICSFYSVMDAQEVGDTTVYKALQEMPRLLVPGCETLDTTLAVKKQCSQQSLLEFVYGNITYPLEARQNGNEGMVVATFVVEKDSTLSNPYIVKDIGGGTGLEVLKLLNTMVQAGIKWVPGQRNGQQVRAQFTLPVRFKLEEALPYTLIGRDTVYSEFETPLSFKGGEEVLKNYLTEKIEYPEKWQDSCLIGRIQLQLIIRKNGEVRILDMIDYNDLGFDFWYESIDAATSTYGRWESATYEGRPVTSAYEVSLPFKPENAGCKTIVDNYETANQIAEEGAILFNDGEKEVGLEKLSAAIELLPRNANLRIMRGQAYLDLNRFDEACGDLRLARSIALINWYDGVLPIICK